jgi:hypothetical protein
VLATWSQAEIEVHAGRIFSKFFTLGQVIETIRGGGIFQPAIDEAIKKLQAGDWVRSGWQPVIQSQSAYSR